MTTPVMDPVEAMLPAAMRVVGEVHDLDSAGLARILDEFHLDESQTALVVALAACVDVDRTPGELLAWYHHPQRGETPSVRALFDRPITTRERTGAGEKRCGEPTWEASDKRHRTAGEKCLTCRVEKSVEMRWRKERARARKAQVAS